MKKITYFIFFLLCCLHLNAQIITIENCSVPQGATTYGPMYSSATANATNRIAIIYPAAQLQQISAEMLTSIYFKKYATTAAMMGTPSLKIYLKHMAADDWGSGALAWADATAGATLVYDGNPVAAVGTDAGWKAFPFTTNFLYSGVENLAVMIEYQNTAASTAITWEYESTGPCALNSNATKYTNNTTGTLPPSLSTSNLRRPSIGFDMVVSCPAPTSINVGSITSESATLSWVAGGTETQWQYAIVPAYSAAPATYITTNSASVPVTGLAPGKNYDLYVKSYCSESDISYPSSPVTFTTACVPLSSFTEDFDSYGTGTSVMPNCWIRAGSSALSYINTGSTLPSSPANRFYMSANGTTPTAAYALLPQLTNLQAGTHRLKFKSWSTTANKQLEVGYLTDISDVNTFVVIETIALPSTTAAAATEFTVVPGPLPAGIDRLVFRNSPISTGITIASIDDVKWEAIPTCTDVSEVMITNIKSTTANVGWQPGASETAWQVIWGLDTVESPNDPTIAGNMLPTTTTNVDLNGLSPQTSYKVWVRSVCGSNYGAWVGPFVFTTSCTAVTSFIIDFDLSSTGSTVVPECWRRAGSSLLTYVTTGGAAPGSAPNRLYMSASGTTPTEAYAIMPPVSNLAADSHRLKFKAYASTAGKFVEVGYLTEFTDTSSFVLLETVMLPSTTAASAEEFILLPTGIPPGVESLVFRNAPTSASTVIYIDDVIWEPIPACPDVLNISVSNPSHLTADVTWEVDGEETAWQVIWAPVAITDPNDPSIAGNMMSSTTENFAVTGLAASTTYNIWVRSDCGGALGTWMGPVVVTTACTPVTAFSENFDSYATGTSVLPTCWERTGSSILSYVTTGGIEPGSAPNRFYMSASGTTPTVAYAILPPVSNLSADTHRLRLKAYSSSANRLLDVGYFDYSSGTAEFVLIESITLPSTTAATATEFVIVPSGVPAEVRSLVFRNAPAATGIALIYIDDVEWQAIPSCADVTEVSITASTNNSATFEWYAGDAETSWEVIWAPDSVTDPADPSIVSNILTSTQTVYTVSSLAAGTDYKVWVRSVCGANKGVWIGPVIFSTECDDVTSFIENFDNYPTGATSMPDCWRREGTSILAYVQTGGAIPGSAPNRFYMSASGTGVNPTEVFAILPSVSNLAAETHRLKFKAYATTAGRVLEVGYLESMYDMTSFVLLETVNLPGTTAATAEEFTIYPTGITEGIKNLVFRNGPVGVSTVLYIDDVIWEAIPNCDDVSLVNFTATTSSSATISWEAGGGEASWEVIWGPDSIVDPQDSAIAGNIMTAAETSATVSLPSPQTVYKIWVRSVCGANKGAWIGPVSVLTDCADVAVFSENFDSYATGSTVLPSCWRKLGSSTSSYVTTGGVSPGSAPNRFYMSATATTEALAVMPPVSNLQADTHKLRFKAYCSTSNKVLQVGYLTDIYDASTFVLIQSIALPGTTAATAQTFEVVPGEIPSGIKNLVFRNGQTASATIYIDDVEWMEIPSCEKPTELQVGILTATTAAISWTESVTVPGVGYEYVFSNTNTIPAVIDATNSGIFPVGSTTGIVSGLAENTAYNLWLRTVCTNDDSSEWSTMVSFMTQCQSVTDFIENFDSYPTGTTSLPTCWRKQGTSTTAYVTTGAVAPGSAPNRFYMSASGTTPTVVYAIIRPVSNLAAGTHRLRFKAYASSAGKSMQVGYFDPSDLSVFVPILVDGSENIMLPGTTAATALEFQVIPTDIPAGVTNLVFRNGPTVSGTTALYIDDLVWEPAPTCADVTSISLSGVTTTTANLVWSSAGSGSNFQVIWGPATVTSPEDATIQGNLTTVSSPAQTISNLMPSSTYKVWIRSVCGSENGSWSSPFMFATSCEPTSVPYTQNFESAVIGTNPICTATFNAGAGNNWEVQNLADYGFNSKVLRYAYDTANAADAWFFTQGINLTAGQTYSISYKYGNNSTTYTEKMKVMVGAAANVGSMSLELANHPTITGAVAQTNELEFVATTTGVHYFGFHAYSGINQFYLYVDDIVVDSALGNEELEISVLSAYPNPVSNMLNLTHTQNISKVEIYNLLGQQVISKSTNSAQVQVDMASLSAGSYLVKVTADHIVKTIKVLKN